MSLITVDNSYSPRYGPALARSAFFDWEIWIGKYLDFSNADNRRFFLNADMTPAPFGLANAILGTPTFAFEGGKDTFPINLGTSGPFDSEVTLEDYTPIPRGEEE